MINAHIKSNIYIYKCGEYGERSTHTHAQNISWTEPNSRREINIHHRSYIYSYYDWNWLHGRNRERRKNERGKARIKRMNSTESLHRSMLMLLLFFLLISSDVRRRRRRRRGWWWIRNNNNNYNNKIKKRRTQNNISYDISKPKTEEEGEEGEGTFRLL